MSAENYIGAKINACISMALFAGSMIYGSQAKHSPDVDAQLVQKAEIAVREFKQSHPAPAVIDCIGVSEGNNMLFPATVAEMSPSCSSLPSNLKYSLLKLVSDEHATRTTRDEDNKIHEASNNGMIGGTGFLVVSGLTALYKSRKRSPQDAPYKGPQDKKY